MKKERENFTLSANVNLNFPQTDVCDFVTELMV